MDPEKKRPKRAVTGTRRAGFVFCRRRRTSPTSVFWNGREGGGVCCKDAG